MSAKHLGPERFALATIADEGVLLDLTTGGFFRVAGSALVAVRALLAGEGGAGAARALAREFGVGQAAAERDVRRLLEVIRSVPVRSRKRPFSFRAATDGFTLSVGKTPVARLLGDGSGVVPLLSGRASLRLAAPHLLALRRTAVLHASSIRVGDGVMAFVGPSGAGKTTFARLLERQRFPVVGRDLLVLASERRVYADGEASILAWTSSRANVVRASPLDRASKATLPLAAIFLLERDDATEPVRASPLRGATAVARLFENAFVELPLARVWADALAMSRALGARGIVYRLRVPNSLSALGPAVDVWQRAGFVGVRRSPHSRSARSG